MAGEGNSGGGEGGGGGFPPAGGGGFSSGGCCGGFSGGFGGGYSGGFGGVSLAGGEGGAVGNGGGKGGVNGAGEHSSFTGWDPSAASDKAYAESTAAIDSARATLSQEAFTRDTAATQAATDATVRPAETVEAPKTREALKEGQQPVIEVQKATAENAKTADILVKADGTIVKPNGDPLAGDKAGAKYTVAVEAGAKDEQVEQALSELKAGLEGKGTTEAPMKPVLEDPDRMVSERAAAMFAHDADADEEKGDGPEGGTDGGGGGGGGGGGDVDTDDKDTEVDDKSQPEVDPAVDAGKVREATREDIRDSFATSLDAQGRPNYMNGSNGSLGAYGENFNNWFSSFLTEEELAALGNPPDPKKMQALLNSPKFKERMKAKADGMAAQGDAAGGQALQAQFDKIGSNEQFAADMCKFMEGQSQGKDASAEDMQKFFPKEVQDAAMSLKMTDTATAMGLNLADKSKPITEDQARDLARNLVAGKVLSADEVKNMSKTEQGVGIETYADMVKQNLHKRLAK